MKGPDQDQITAAIRRWVTATGRIPYASEWGSSDLPTSGTVRRRFGSVAEAVRAAGFQPRATGTGQRNYKPRDEHCAACGHQKRRKDGRLCPRCYYTKTTLEQAPCVTCGQKTKNARKTGRCRACARAAKIWDEPAILAAISREGAKHGGELAQTDWPKADGNTPSLGTIRARFGSWTAARDRAGVSPRSRLTPNGRRQRFEANRQMVTGAPRPFIEPFGPIAVKRGAMRVG
jgi:hypothetical protein